MNYIYNLMGILILDNCVARKTSGVEGKLNVVNKAKTKYLVKSLYTIQKQIK